MTELDVGILLIVVVVLFVKFVCFLDEITRG